MKLHVDIRLSEAGGPTGPDKASFEALTEKFRATYVEGSIKVELSPGHADILVRVKSRSTKAQVIAARALIDASPFADLATIRIVHGKSGIGAPGRMPLPGDVFVFPTAPGKMGVCRVLRYPTRDEEAFFGGTKVLIALSPWIGDALPAISLPALRETVSYLDNEGATHREVFWIGDPPPESYRRIGHIEPSPEEKMERSRTHGGWACSIFLEGHLTRQKNKEANQALQTTPVTRSEI